MFLTGSFGTFSYDGRHVQRKLSFKLHFRVFLYSNFGKSKADEKNSVSKKLVIVMYKLVWVDKINQSI